MKLTTRASRAPGVSSVGMIWATTASTLDHLFRREKREAIGLAGVSGGQHELLRSHDARIVRGDPGGAQTGNRPQPETNAAMRLACSWELLSISA